MKKILLLIVVVMCMDTGITWGIGDRNIRKDENLSNRDETFVTRNFPKERKFPKGVDAHRVGTTLKSGTVMKHMKEVEYYWWSEDEQTWDWNYTRTRELTRNSSGQVVAIQQVDTVFDIIQYKEVFFKDQLGRDTAVINYYWDLDLNDFYANSKDVFFYDPVSGNYSGELSFNIQDDEWVVSSGWKEDIKYDPQGTPIMYTNYMWDSATKKWIARWREIVEYEGGKIAREIYQRIVFTEPDDDLEPLRGSLKSGDEPDDSQLVNSSKSEYSYSGDMISQVIEYDWVDDEWIPSEKYYDIVWEGSGDDMMPVSYKYSDYDSESGEWVPAGKFESLIEGETTFGMYYYYDFEEEDYLLTSKWSEEILPNGYRGVNYEQNKEGEFLPADRYSNFYDEFGNYLGYLDEVYDHEEETWVLVSGSEYQFIYNSGGLLAQKIHSYFSEEVWTPSSRVDYLDYKSITGTKTHEFSLKVYPNPTTGIVHVNTRGALHGERLQVIDLQGRIIEDRRIGTEVETVDLSGQARGMYLIRVGESRTKIIVR